MIFTLGRLRFLVLGKQALHISAELKYCNRDIHFVQIIIFNIIVLDISPSNLKCLMFVIFQMNLNEDDKSFKNKIKQHENNITFLTYKSNHLTESVLDLQGMSRNNFLTCFYLMGVIRIYD